MAALVLFLIVGCGFGLASRTVSAAEEDGTIYSGIYADGIDLSGMTKEEATQAVSAYVESLKEKQITMYTVNHTEIIATAEELGMIWNNPDLVDDAYAFGRSGNIVARYKARKDLENHNQVFEIALDFDESIIQSVITEYCAQFNVEPENAHLIRENGAFRVEEGKTGYVVDEAASAEAVYRFLTTGWNHDDASVDMVIDVQEPQGKTEDLMKVKDVLGTFTTAYTSSGKDRSANVANGAKLINATTVYPGETFSTYEKVSPFSAENGYYMAGSYLNGQVVDSIGGGICQVSTTLYNAVLNAELEVTERHNHSMIVNYVDPSADAAIAESAGKDFQFVNNTDYPIYIEGYTQDKKITFTIYGVETRSKDRKVTYESEVLEKNVPEEVNVIADAGQPVGYVKKEQSAHIGYKARLWKVVQENGVEVSREQVNSSSYKATPATVRVGTATSDPNAAAQIQAAIDTKNYEHIKNVAAGLQAAASMTPEQLAMQQMLEAQQALQAQQQAEAEAAAQAAAAGQTQ